MLIRGKVRFLFLVLLALAAVLAAPASPGERALLLKITPPAAEALHAVEAEGGVLVQELRSCLLVRVPEAALPRLSAGGFSCSTVAAPEAGESHFLLRTTQVSPLRGGGDGSRCLLLEEGIWLLATREPGFRSRLVQPYSLKALQLQATFPARREGTAQGPDGARSRPAGVIPDLVAEVSAGRLRAGIQALQDFKTRFASTPECEAAGAFLLKSFRQMGLEAESDPFTFETLYQSQNILAVIPGKTSPERMVLVCAHYDSISNNPLVSAPGADDNASGTAALLEMARILAGEHFDFSIGLLCVSAEEWGLYGSAHYARQARQAGAAIVGVVNLDMIAFPGGQQRVLDVIGNRESEWLANRFIAAGQPYVGLRLKKVINPSLTWSDHSSFWDQDYPALCGIEDSDNPYYHRTSDTLDTLDLDFAVEAVKAALATVADLAQPLSLPAAPIGLRARSQVSASLFASRKTVYLEWQANREPVAGYHVYRSLVSHQGYVRLTEQPVVGTSYTDPLLLPDPVYYYVLSAVDAEGRESNYSVEIRDDQDN